MRLCPIPIKYGSYEGSERDFSRSGAKNGGRARYPLPCDRAQKYMEKGHPAARMDYSCLDVELDLTIQFEMSDDGRKSKNPGFRGKH